MRQRGVDGAQDAEDVGLELAPVVLQLEAFDSALTLLKEDGYLA